MIPQEQIAAMKTKLTEMINQKNQAEVDIRNLRMIIDKLETIAESAGNPNMAADLVEPFEEPK